MFFDNKPSQASSSASTPGSSTSTATSRRAENQDGSDRKRRRVQRACDMCRLKKVKCEGGHPSRKACTNCVVNKYDCTYMQMARLEVRDKAHVRNLEARLAKMEQLVRKFAPDLDAAQDLLDVQPSPVASAKSPAASAASAEPHGAQTPISMGDSDFDSDEEEAGTRKTIEDYLQGLSITPALPSLVGKSSALMLVRTVLESKPPELGQQRSPQLSLSESPSAYGHLSGNVTRFWESHTWESRPSGPKHQFTFPEPDLLPILVDNYFQEHNVDSPLLHRPTFERNMARGLHFSDEGFGAVLLLVCALGSRHTEDPRTFAAGEEYGGLPGGRWFVQVRRTLSIIHLETPRLYDLQIAALSSAYLTRTANPQITCWLMIGHGIKMAQVVGAHRKKVYAMMPPVERELLKRVFWILVKADRELSYYLGRPCTMQDEDFDVDLPLECDDEYWQPDDPSKAFMQPGGKPSNITYFNWALKLSQIQSYALRTIYSITKARVTLGHIGSEWEEKIVMELDSALNQWLDTLPEHLRWNPKEPDFAALTHTAGLHSGFYNLQMIVHRPFLSPRRQKVAAFPSLTICTNAARAALRILDVQYTRAKEEGKAGVGAIGTILVAGIILLLSVISQKRAGSNTATLQADADLVQRAVYMIMAHSAGSPAIRQGGNSLCELMRVAGLPVPRESDSPYFHSSTSSQWQGTDTNTSAQQQLYTNAPVVNSRTLDATLAASPTVHPDPWNPHPQFSTNSFPSATIPSNSQPQHMTNTFPHTDEDMGGFGYAFGNPAQAPPPFEVQWAGAGVGVGVGESAGFADVPGFQWGEWGSLFASALGDGEGFDFGGSNGGGEGFGFGGAGGNGDGRGQ